MNSEDLPLSAVDWRPFLHALEPPLTASEPIPGRDFDDEDL